MGYNTNVFEIERIKNTSYNYCVNSIDCAICIYCHDVTYGRVNDDSQYVIYCKDANDHLIANVHCDDVIRLKTKGE